MRATSRSFIDILIQLSPFEKVLVFILAVAALVSGTQLLYKYNDGTLVEMPRSGGSYIEGIAGTPRFINPLLAISDADKDLTKLVYAGLLTRDSSGTLVPELAQSYSVSEDGLTYTFTLKEGLTFHDGTALTAADVVFTIEQAANAALLSPVFANWENADVAQIDDRTVTFTLPEAYVPFIENMTLGILPRHIWEGVQADEYRFSQFNITPIGAGPYEVVSVTRDKSGIPTSYELAASETYALGRPHIDTIEFKLYDSKLEALAAFAAGTVHAVGGVPYSELTQLVSDPIHTEMAIRRTPLLRTFNIFFNHNRQPLLLRDEVREALDVATPKQALVGDVLSGYGTVLDGPVPEFLYDTLKKPEEEATTTTASTTETKTRVEEAQEILEDGGWERNEETNIYEREIDEETRELSLTIATLNTPELTAAADLIASTWREVGVAVEINVFEPTDLVQSVVRPRRFDVLLYGMVLGHENDLYAFWHSSQRNDPGLNIAQYADIEADALLEEMRVELDTVARQELYGTFNELVKEKHAAIFLYMPDYTYVVANTVHNMKLHPVTEPCERFDAVHEWYIDTDRVWPPIKDAID